MVGGCFHYKYADIAAPGKEEWTMSRVSVIFHGQWAATGTTHMRRNRETDFMQINAVAWKSPRSQGSDISKNAAISCKIIVNNKMENNF